VRTGRTPVPQALLPGWLRWPAAVLLALCAAVTAALAVHFAGQDQPGRLDAAIDPRIRAGLGHFPRLLSWLPDLGTLAPVALIVLTLVFACAATRRWSGAALTAVAVPAAIGLTEYVLKPVVGRGLHHQSLPSGHATAMFALAAACAVLLVDPPGRRVRGVIRLLLVLAALAVAVSVSGAMVAIGAHHFTDTAAGAAVGTGLVLASALVLDLVTGQGRRPGSLRSLRRREASAAASARPRFPRRSRR
jgi:membrane-associated phospholipid phosphatase